MERYLPEWIYDRLVVFCAGWEFHAGAKMHRRLGKVFVAVTPDECSLWIAEPSVANVVLHRRKEFQQPELVGRIINFLGPTLLAANGEDWQRQRRVIAPNLNERISKSVWDESCHQAAKMSDYLVRNSGNKTIDGLRNIAINVLGRSSYGQNQEWTPDEPVDTSDIHQELTYFKSISLVTSMLLPAAFIPPILMDLWFLPTALRLLGRGLKMLPKLTSELLENERRVAEVDQVPRNNLLSQMVQLSDHSKASKSGLTLTEEEIHGNLFLFSAAGFDTTANTMGYGVTLLAAYPEWQDWMREDYHGLDSDPSSWVYEDIFPRCKRTLAVMFETLRLFTPVLHSYRCTNHEQLVTDESGSHRLANGMDVFVNQAAIHRDSSIWGADSEAFKPSRWIDSSGDLITPEKGTFIPWSGGPRICPGIKMAQVEFVATFATLFYAAKCESIAAGVNPRENARFLESLMRDSFFKLSLQMKHPSEVRLRWIPQGCQ
ncbi:uncharacterized protein PV09_07225 [Verruconis gallopava]|uniref:Cytochrome P450 n=1 Tax=Verruconis gallopava TaxID=253628 RepID=A0A0D2A3S6_9PEZI|nr:uncharacterized protein PV09_07225 [Verruconis gallopava]KIW01468.1 hypothetical protein PV09_07225 [Verruconis gallopava]